MTTAPRLEILGPLRLWRAGAELDTGPRQQAVLLALLLARAGRPVSTGELVDLIWAEDVPASALNVIHKYVGNLRRLLEPELSARGTGSYLHRRGSGYLFTPDAGTLDLQMFRRLAESAQAHRRNQQPAAALDAYVEALALWRGPAGAGLDAGSAATAVFAALDGEFYDACAAAAQVAMSLGRPAAVLPALRRAATMAPLHEPVQATLIDTLGAAGQEADALEVFEAVRDRLAGELGLDPGRLVQEAHQRVIAGRRPPSAVSAAAPDRRGDRLVGRAEEFSALRATLAAALTGGTGLAVIEGEPGVGKTRLMNELAAEAGRRGVQVLRGSCPEGDGTPVMWPWMQVIGGILDSVPANARARWLAGDLGQLITPREDILTAPVPPDAGSQFRLFEQIVALVAQVTQRQPALLMIDDLQWTDLASLRMFNHLTARLPGGAAVVGALRDRAPVPGSELSRTLAAVSRVPGHRRITLGPLGPGEVAELVRREIGPEADAGVTPIIYDRAGGNAFFVRELARFLADGGAVSAEAAARAGVPSGVRDVVRDRMGGLGEPARDLLRIAALIGREVDLDLLAGAAGIGAGECFERLEPVEAAGLVDFVPDDPFTLRFAHDLVRQSVGETTPPRRASRLHLAVADALERKDPGVEPVAERLAHHLWRAGPLADPVRTAGALVRAAGHATAKCALEAAERQLRSAVEVARKAGQAELELVALAQLTTVVGMQSLFGDTALDLLERAEHLARSLGRRREATDFLFSRWAAHAQGIRLDRSGPLARRLLDQGEASGDPALLEYGLHAWGIHQWAIGDIAEAHRILARSDSVPVPRDEDPLRHDLQLLSIGTKAEITALHGDVDTARVQLGALEISAEDDPYVITVWASFATRIAVEAGEPAWALNAAERGIAVDPDFSFRFLGTYQRLALWWARAVTGRDPAGAVAEAESLIASQLLDPPRSCIATWYALLGEMLLAAGSPEKALVALDRADQALADYGQRYPEGLVLLIRARALAAAGEPVEVVRAAAVHARTLSAERGAHLFARRCDDFLATVARAGALPQAG